MDTQKNHPPPRTRQQIKTKAYNILQIVARKNFKEKVGINRRTDKLHYSKGRMKDCK